MYISPAQLARIWHWLLPTCLLLLCVALVMALALGAVAIESASLWAWMMGASDAQTQLIIESLRLPRALVAAGVGAILAICGCAAQGLFRNPLADPSLIGVTAGASVGASLVIVCLDFNQWGWLGLSLVSVGAFLGAVLVVVCVYRLASQGGFTSVSTMLLAGVACSYLAGSLSNALEFIADNQRLRQLSLWRMGGLDGADLRSVLLVVTVLVCIYMALYREHRALNALLLGESEARYLGLDVARVKRRVIVCIAAGVGVAVAVAGAIAFVGLVVPHMMRLLIGPNHKYLLPLSACMGAILLVFADTLARTLLAPTELPVGLLTAVLGAPVFLSLLRKRQNYGGA
jgi:iron complex transport system permease protein